MSKMNFKSTLWALAFACAAVSCSDDLENGPNNNEGNELNGPTAKVNVMVNTEMTTKARAGENGDNNEVGSEDEYTVKDVAIVLYNQSGTDWSIKNDCELVAAGWTDQVGVMENSDVTTGTPGFPNGKMTTVEVKVKEDSPLLGNTYGVIAVTNLGKTEGEALVDKISAENGYKSVGDLDKALYKNQRDKWHVMSTHAIEGSNNGKSQVTFTNNAAEIPAVTVYVERLSAKIRLSKSEATADENPFEYTVSSTMVDGTPVGEDKILLTNVAIVNQLTSGSFLLKRVSATDSEVATTGDLGTDKTTDVIIGDETTDNTNFVIDPWVRVKTKENLGKVPPYTPVQDASYNLEYTNPFTDDTYGDLWSTTFTEKVTIPNNLDGLDDQKDLFLCYTQENTLSKAGSLHGYTTGAIFKATYDPARWMALISTEGEDKGAVKPVERAEDAGETFYTFTSGGKEYIYQDYHAILAYIIAKANISGVNYYSFTDVGNSKFGENIDKLRAYADEDPFGYIKAMVAQYDGDKAYIAIDTYLNGYSPVAGEETTAFNKRVKKYTDGVCYYPYWILHAGDGKGTTTKAMEYGIVRNNIYDMTVTKISGLGLSEVDVTDPEGPDKDSSLKIQVNLYVKNWVVRSNSGIIL